MNYSSLKEDKIAGLWRSEDKTVKIEIYRADSSETFHGKIVWVEVDEENPAPAFDHLNPDPSLQSRPIVGLQCMTGLVFNKRKQEWKNGQLYNPEEGKSYHLKGWFDDGNVLHLRASTDSLSLLGKTFRWYDTRHEMSKITTH